MSIFRQAALFVLTILAILFLSGPCLGATDRIAGSLASGKAVRLNSAVPLQARPEFDRGSVDPSLRLGYMTLLTVPSRSQQKALDLLLVEQQTQQSSLYHKWLTPEQYADRFGLSSNDTHKIVVWLEARGFRVLGIARARNFVTFSGTAAQVETAFFTPIHRFEVDGEMHFSNTTPPSIPAVLSGIVTGIRGLSNFRPKPRLIHSKPRYTLPVSGGNSYFLAPGDIAAIYDIDPLYSAGVDGTGQTLAVMGQTDVYFADLDDFRNYFGLPRFTCTNNSSNVITACNATNFKYVLVNNDPGTPATNDLSEADIDIEWSGAVARNAQIIYVNAPDPNSGGVWDAWYYAVDHNVAPVITMSYGQCELGEGQDGSSGEGTFSSDEAELKQANTEGITFLNSSGDIGAAECDAQSNDPTGGYAVSYPASSPEVTGVGGTLIPYANYTSTYWGTSNNSTGGSVLQYIPEEAWNDAQEWSEYCSAYPSDKTCTSNPLSSWSAAQAFLGVAASGGGLSNCATETGGVCATPPNGGFPQPSWQANLAIPGQSTAVRLSPDVSLLASVYWPGYIVCTPIEEVRNGSNDTTSVCANGIQSALNNYGSTVGGTSLSSPIFAGIVTLVNDYLVRNGVQSTPGLGNINPKLYDMAASVPSAFHRVTTGSNGVYCQPHTPSTQPSALECPFTGFLGFDASSYDSTTGYNLATGLGSVDVNNLAANWQGNSTTPSYSVSSNPSSTSVSAGQSGSSTITVSAANGFSGTVSLSCAVPTSAAGMSCSLSPSSVSLTSTSTSVTTTLTVRTTSSSDRIGKPIIGNNRGYTWLAGGAGGMLCASLIVFPIGRRHRRYEILMFLFVIVALAASCSGNGGGGTPKGTYTVTVTATSGSYTHDATVSVTVQ